MPKVVLGVPGQSIIFPFLSAGVTHIPKLPARIYMYEYSVQSIGILIQVCSFFFQPPRLLMVNIFVQ